MTQFTKLNNLLAERLEPQAALLLEDTCTTEAVTLANEAIQNILTVNIQELRNKLQGPVTKLEELYNLYDPTGDKTIKLKKKASLTGDDRLYNEKKSAEILAYCKRHEELGGKLRALSESLTPAWKILIDVEESKINEIAESKKAEESRLAEELERKRKAEEQEQLELERRKEEARIQAEQEEFAATEKARKEYEAKLASKADAEKAKRKAAEEEVANRVAIIKQQADSQLAELHEKAKPKEAADVNSGFVIRAKVVGEDLTLAISMESDSATVADLKTKLLQMIESLKEDQIIVFAGGRTLQDDWTLRRCRLRKNALVQVGSKQP